MKEEEPLYVGVFDPVGLRKDVLSSVKIIIGSLKKYEDFLAIRQEKDRQVSRLKSVMRELSILNSKLAERMPKTAARQRQKPAESEGVSRMPEAAPRQRITAEKPRLEQLEDELAAVEEKLKGME